MVEVRFHCTECDDFDLCVSCYNQEGHHHKMERLKFSEFSGVLGEDGTGSVGSSGDMDSANDTTSPAEYRRLTIQRCIQSLVHACQCRDANCRSQSCQRMKRVVSHAKSCKKKQTSNQTQTCSICRQLIALCCYHAKHCTEQKCLVPYCNNFKNKLEQQKIQQRVEQNHILLRRIATMSRQMNPPPSSSSNSQGNNSQAISSSPGEYSPSHQSQSSYGNQSYGKGGQAALKSSPPPPG